MPGGKFGSCAEWDCLYIGKRSEFSPKTGSSRSGNDHWRDPIAMLPGGYEDNQNLYLALDYATIQGNQNYQRDKAMKDLRGIGFRVGITPFHWRVMYHKAVWITYLKFGPFTFEWFVR